MKTTPQGNVMDNRQRFYETLHFGKPDRIPYFEEGIRQETIDAWRTQGLLPDADPATQFPSDERVEIRLELYPNPEFKRWPTRAKDLKRLRKRLNPSDPSRLPDNWVPEEIQRSKKVRMIRPHEGFFLSMGVRDGETFTRLMYQVYDQPEFVREWMQIVGDFAAALAEKCLEQVEFDAMIFSEPIGDNNGALISPRLYEELVLPTYEPLLALARRYGVKTIICRTYASMKALIPSLMKWGIDCLWACEVEQGVMNYPALRREFGNDLKLIGGIDLDALRAGKEAIRQAVDEIAPLVRQGGYIPLADGRVRPDVAYENYVYYRKLLKELTTR
jgi:uroporphyrinogen decarboxylase